MCCALAVNAPVTALYAQSHIYSIRIESGSLGSAIASLSLQTGASIGVAGQLPDHHVKGFGGQMTVYAALTHMLKGTGWRAVKIGDNSYRLERGKAQKPGKTRTPPKASPPPVPVQVSSNQRPKPVRDRPTPPPREIVVIGSKSETRFSSIAQPVHVVSGDDLAGFGITPDTGDIASLSANLTLTNLGPGLNRPFIRGVADSPFSGFSQSTVAMELDSARVGFNSPDPNLQLIDIDRVEILEGPQGPSHGTGALGGVFHIVTNAPDASGFSGFAAVEGTAVQGAGALGYEGAAMLNLPIARDAVALRVVAYHSQEPGWIGNAATGDSSSNSARVYGGRAALRWETGGWQTDLAVAGQKIATDDSQWLNQSDPKFSRSTGQTEPNHNYFKNGRLTVRKAIGGINFLSSTSVTKQEVSRYQDASAVSDQFSLSQPMIFDEEMYYNLFNQELRANGGGAEGVQWMAGLSYLHATTDFSASFQSPDRPDTPISALMVKNQEAAAFGALDIPIGRHFRIAANGRLFWTNTQSDRLSIVENYVFQRRKWGVSPGLTISWLPSDDGVVYLRYATAFRPGGLSPFVEVPPVVIVNEEEEEDAADSGVLLSDSVRSLDLGARFASRDGRWSWSGNATLSDWKNLQSDYILANGLIGTRNAGDALLFGLGLQGAFNPTPSLSLSAGLNWQHARLERPAAWLVNGHEFPLPVVPPIKANGTIAYRFPIGDWELQTAARVDFQGRRQLAIDPQINRSSAPYALTSVNLSGRNGPWQVNVNVDNLLNSAADSFPYGNSFAIQDAPQYTPVCPSSEHLAQLAA